MSSLIPKVQWNTKSKTVILNGIFLRGITDLLKNTFYPQYTYRRALLGPNTQSSVKSPSETGLKGKRLGINVDKEICRYFTKTLAFEKCSKETRCLLQYCEDHKLTILHCQFPVANKAAKICTNIDIIAKDTNGKTVIIELKTGYRRYKFNYVGSMKHPFEQLHDSPYNQHQLQLFITTHLFKLSFANTPCRSILLYLYEDEVVQHDLLKCFNSAMIKDVHNRFIMSKDETKRMRHTRKRKRCKT
jgi:hypothetical protein